MLEVGDRVHSDRIGNLPCLFRQPFDRIRGPWAEDLAVLRLQDEQNIVVLGIGLLEKVERQELRVLVAEEDPVVVGKFKQMYTVARGRNRE